MIVALLFVFGLALGSFVNALVWRIRELESVKSKSKRKKLSPLTGRSMCPQCKHELAAKDLVPVLSWLQLSGKCRYCSKKISWQYPLVELLHGRLFVALYVFWPLGFGSVALAVAFMLWLLIATCFTALFVYDLKWMELPNSVVAAVVLLSALYVGARVFGGADLQFVISSVVGAVSLFGLFYALFQVSKGAWIGGGDVKLALALGLLVGGALEVLLVLFIASFLGSVIGVPLIARSKSKKRVKLPFGPLLIFATYAVFLWGDALIEWYTSILLIS